MEQGPPFKVGYMLATWGSYYVYVSCSTKFVPLTHTRAVQYVEHMTERRSKQVPIRAHRSVKHAARIHTTRMKEKNHGKFEVREVGHAALDLVSVF